MWVHPSVCDQGSAESRRRDQLTAGPTCHRERTQSHAETQRARRMGQVGWFRSFGSSGVLGFFFFFS
jgi:hypothetical protein